MSVFLRRNHLFLRNPRGGVEDIAAMKYAGFEAIFCNIGDHQPSEWAEIRLRARTLGVECGPWLRTAEGNNQFSAERLRYLISTADSWEAPLIVNSESELKGSDWHLTTLIASELGNRDAAISMECWPFANVDWTPLAKYPILPQIFPQEAEAARNPAACRSKWYEYGVKCVVFTFGAYGGQRPSDYSRLSPYGVYSADDCGGNYVPWSRQGNHNPCVNEPSPPEEEMQKIGDQHGITAMANVFRAQWPDKTGKPNSDDVSTWKAIDKWERTMLMLAADHDQMISRFGDSSKL